MKGAELLKLDILDPYNIRARLSPSIILLGPIALTLFFCFESVYNATSSAVSLVILFAMTNYIPILQRRLSKRNMLPDNYAARLLHWDNTEIDKLSKQRYYEKLASLDPSFSIFRNPSDTKEFKDCCESAVIYLRNNTRDNHLVYEENINCGFCKNMLIDKPIGITINIVLAILTFLYSWMVSGQIAAISHKNWFSICINLLFVIFWIFAINKKMLEESAKRYAYTLITSIDSLKPKESKDP